MRKTGRDFKSEKADPQLLGMKMEEENHRGMVVAPWC